MHFPTSKISLSEKLRQVPKFFRVKRESFKSLDDALENDQIQLYDAYTIDQCRWPQTPDGEYARRCLVPLMKKGVSSYIENIQTDLRVLVCGQLVIPITINQTEYTNAYMCSPYSYYISYAGESLGFIKQPWIVRSVNVLLWIAGKILKYCQINKVICVNNWLYSTSLYPVMNPQQIEKIADFLKKQFPDHTLIFRSVDPDTNPICYQTLNHIGFDYIASRQIFFMNPQKSTFFESRLFKSDLKLLQNSGYEVVDGNQLSEKDIPRLLSLYRDLYLNKYSTYNPQFNEGYLHLALKQNLLHFKALKKEGRIDGVVGYVKRNGMMQCPLFGYDLSIPQEKGLYRLMSTVLMLEAYHQGLFFHQSSGASAFKKMRKANSGIEYTAVHCRHLPLKRKLPWLILKGIYNTLGKKYMVQY